MADTVCFADYDVFGFDIDHTLAKYNIPNLFNLLNSSLTNFLQKHGQWKEGANKEFDKDFCCRGMVFDRKKGNFLKLAEDGFILRASHGTKYMTDDDIKQAYGDGRHWECFELLIGNVNNIGDDYRIFENFFDMPLIVPLARLVDQIDDKASEDCVKIDSYDVWPTLMPAAEDAYAQAHFRLNTGGFFPEFKGKTDLYVEPCTDNVKQWLKRLKAAGKKLFIMTSSFVDYATYSMKHILGDDWQDYFDLYITNAKKPGFFKKNNHFLATVDNARELYPVDELKIGGIYSQGNIKDFNKFLTKITGKAEPKVCYFGDSLRSDVFPGKVYAGWECVMILEEMLAEQWQGGQLLHKDDDDEDSTPAKRQKTWGPSQLEKEYLTSEHWGSFFTDDHAPTTENSPQKPCMNTLWGFMIRKYADLAIPQLEYISDFPLDKKYKVFNHEESHQWGFYPDTPLALKALNNKQEDTGS